MKFEYKVKGLPGYVMAGIVVIVLILRFFSLGSAADEKMLAGIKKQLAAVYEVTPDQVDIIHAATSKPVLRFKLKQTVVVRVNYEIFDEDNNLVDQDECYFRGKYNRVKDNYRGIRETSVFWYYANFY